jgi:hypothetical protein
VLEEEADMHGSSANLALEDLEQAAAEADAEAEKADLALRRARPRAAAEPRCPCPNTWTSLSSRKN